MKWWAMSGNLNETRRSILWWTRSMYQIQSLATNAHTGSKLQKLYSTIVVKPLLLLHDSWDSNESCTMHSQQKKRVLANIAEKPCLRMCAEDWVGWICWWGSVLSYPDVSIMHFFCCRSISWASGDKWTFHDFFDQLFSPMWRETFGENPALPLALTNSVRGTKIYWNCFFYLSGGTKYGVT